MKKHVLFFCLVSIALSLQIRASILMSGEKTIIFHSNKIPAGTTWHTEFNLTDNGLVFRNLPPNGFQETWVQTEPFPIGYSWRPPSSAGFRVFLDGSFADNAGIGGPRVFLRYSCDKKNWSTWYEADRTEERNPDGLRMYKERISIPSAVTGKYYALMQEWQKSGLAWTSDETEFCEWLVRKEPHFFENDLPFIGYVQVRLEKYSTHSFEELKSLTIWYDWGINGMTSLINDKARVRKNTEDYWFFTGMGN